MAASFRWNEYNGAGETETTGISNANCGNSDAPNLVVASYPTQVGANAYDKWLKVDFYGGTFNKVDNFKFWRSDASGGNGAALPTDVLVKGEVGVGADLTYTTPATSSIAASNLASTEAGALSPGPAAGLTATGKSYYLHFQLQTGATAATGNGTFYVTFRYDEQ